jgi:hypothetical protein
VWCLRLGEPLLCRLGFHKWQNYGKKIEVFWEEPNHIKAGIKDGFGTSVGPPRGNIEVRSKSVYEGRECKRCGIKLRRKLVTNSNGTLSSVGWEPNTEGATKNRQ